jgi:DhnA family fructose-bisphosphate aldolase class Ia
MEKKGDLFNQLAIVSDLLEKCNVISTNQTIVFELSREEFVRIYKLTQLKAKKSLEVPKTSFSVKIGGVDIVFNMSNV